MRPGGFGINPINALEVTDFPEPDSPTIANVSPFFKSKVTPRTACTSPACVSKETCKSFTSNNVFIFASPLFYLRIFGSNASRNPSAIKLNAKINILMTTAGMNIICGYV
ncbi:Uncharacterised protein [Streptococcus pneumoniae]|nr:Uncharacterised protein [Streptococcus pneumoniae]CKF12730.1 Uncharacterised protein [Streptococcus pneumoniae]